MAPSNSVPLYVAGAVTTAGVIGGAYYVYRLHQERNKLPEEWTDVGYLKELYIYPIKSVAPVVVDKGECSMLGMRDGYIRDRHLMVINAADNNFITARVYPELMKVQPSYNNNILILSGPGMEPVEVDLEKVLTSQKAFTATVWQTPVPVYDCGEAVGKWFTKYLNRKDMSFRLVYYASDKGRKMVNMPKILHDKYRKNDLGTFGDEATYSSLCEPSVEDLNTRLTGIKVSVRSFRPNFYIAGIKQPYDEDNWNYMKIGGNIFEVIKPCTRCMITNVDPDSASRHEDLEPLKTLRTYRLMEDPAKRKAAGNAPRLGLSMALRTEPGGTLSVGDRVYVADSPNYSKTEKRL